METLKEVIKVIGAIIGVLTGLLTLYAKYIDLKKKASQNNDAAVAAARSLARGETPAAYAPPVSDTAAFERAKGLVKAPAIAIIVVGGLGVLLSLAAVGTNFVLGMEKGGGSLFAVAIWLSLAVASGAAVWAGCGMLRLQSYWLSVAGSFAVMPGALLFCVVGIPIGVWSLAVLRKPEVSSSFR